MELTRHPKWEARLSAYLTKVKNKRFRWGRHDCGLFVNGAVKAVTGRDLFGANAGAYKSKREAAQLLRELGHGTLTAATTHFLGEPVHPAKAGRGDVVQAGKAIGIVAASGWAWFVGEQRRVNPATGKTITTHGLMHLPVLQCDLAWKVG